MDHRASRAIDAGIFRESKHVWSEEDYPTRRYLKLQGPEAQRKSAKMPCMNTRHTLVILKFGTVYHCLT